MQLTVNGETQTFAQPLTAQQLLTNMALEHKRLAMERNGELLPKSQHAQTWLKDGDTIEIVVAVGGG